MTKVNFIKFKNFQTMKKLTGMKKNFSSLENKKLVDLKSVQGGKKAIRSNVSNAQGCVEFDYYNEDGSYDTRGWLCVG